MWAQRPCARPRFFFRECTRPGGTLLDSLRKTMDPLRPVSRLVTPRHRASAASRPRRAGRCFPAYRSNTSSKCSSCRCCIRSNSSPCWTTAATLTPTMLDILVAILVGRRGTQSHLDRRSAVSESELRRTTNKTRLLSPWKRPLLLCRFTSSHLRLRRSPLIPKRFLLHQIPRRWNLQRTALLLTARNRHQRQKMISPYLCR